MINRIAILITLIAFAFFTSGFDDFAISTSEFFGSYINYDALNVDVTSSYWVFAVKIFVILSLVAISEVIVRIYKITIQKPFKKISPHISKLQSKYNGLFPGRSATEQDIALYISEVRGIFCKYFESNEISVTLFRVVPGQDGLACESSITADVDGFVGTPLIPRRFEEGEGFVGIALNTADMFFGVKKRFVFFDNPDFKKFKRDNHSNSFSFWCFPVFSLEPSIKENICYMICIETDRSKYFNIVAKRDEYSKDIRNNIDSTLKNMYNSINEG